MAYKDLTPGEARAFKAYMVHETHVRAAEALGISTQTLKNHLGSAYKKLGRQKAHSALYKMCLDQGIDPIPGPAISAGLTDSQVSLHNDTDEAAS